MLVPLEFSSRCSGQEVERTPSNLLAATPRRKLDRKSTRLNSSHQIISYAVFCLKKKNTKRMRSMKCHSADADEIWWNNTGMCILVTLTRGTVLHVVPCTDVC